MSNDLREVAYAIAELGCPTTADMNGESQCFYCYGDHLKLEGAKVTRTEEINHAGDCPWPPFEQEALA